MASYVDIDGHPTWVDDRGGSGEPLLLLHGGLSNSDELLGSIGPELSSRYRVVAFDRRGHGYTADTDAEFHYADMATQTIRVLEDVIGGPAHLVGWSDGGILALLVALDRPDLVRKLVVVGTNFHYEGMIPLQLDPQSALAQQLAADYIERTPDGAEHLDIVFAKSLEMFSTEPTLDTDDIARIERPTLVVVGDDDLPRLDHTCALYESLREGQLAVVPGASHFLPVEQPEELGRLIVRFLAAEGPPQTLMPIRRAARTVPG